MQVGSAVTGGISQSALRRRLELNGLLPFAFAPGWVAFDAVFKGVHVEIVMEDEHFVDIMAGVTWIRRIGAGVAGFAIDRPFSTVIDQESVRFQFGRGPGGSAVAAFTTGPKDTSMQFRLRMAVQAGPVRLGIGLVGVAVLAVGSGVGAVQQVEAIVIELAHPVSPIVALQAVQAVGIHVFCHTVVIMVGVAGEAVQRAIHITALQMAGFAIQRLAIVALLVMR